MQDHSKQLDKEHQSSTVPYDLRCALIKGLFIALFPPTSQPTLQIWLIRPGAVQVSSALTSHNRRNEMTADPSLIPQLHARRLCMLVAREMRAAESRRQQQQQKQQQRD